MSKRPYPEPFVLVCFESIAHLRWMSDEKFQTS